MRYFYMLCGSVLLGLSSFQTVAQAQKFKVEEEPGLTPHYLCAEKRSLRDILLQRWAPYEFPIKVYLPFPPAELQLPDPDLQYRAVQEAFRRWSQASPYASFAYVSEPSKDGIQVNWHNHIFYEDGRGVWGNAYLPAFFWSSDDPKDPKRKILHWSKINLAVRARLGSAMMKNETPLLSEREMRDLAIHEIGHALGLKHSDSGGDIMAGRKSRLLISELDMRNISARDVRTLQFLYSLPYHQKTHPCPDQS